MSRPRDMRAMQRMPDVLHERTVLWQSTSYRLHVVPEQLAIQFFNSWFVRQL